MSHTMTRVIPSMLRCQGKEGVWCCHARAWRGLTRPLHKHSDRIPDSYLWQRAPTRLVGGHDSRTQEEPTQYILPYDAMIV